MASLLTFVVKDAVTIRDDILRTIKNGLIQQGVASPNTSPNSDWYIIATALGNELAVVGANAVVKADAQMPDSSTDDDLTRIAALFGLAKQAAAGSVGSVVITASATSPITTGAELQDASGLRYRVTVGGNYADQASVPIEAIDVGASTNHAEGDVLKWRSAPTFCSDQVLIDVGGLVNGIDAEDDEVLRARLFALLQDPPGSGNWEHVAEVAEASTPRVQKAFPYPAVEGPATVDVAVTAAPTSTSKNRDVASAVLTGTVTPYTKGKLPEHANITVTTVANVNADVAFALSLPEAPTANPPGPGGGWVNGSPWPAPSGVSGIFRCTVTLVTSSTVFRVDAQTSPTIGVSRIAWLSPSTWTLYTALVTSVSGSAGAYTVTIDRPFTGITTGAYIWPECENAQGYVDTALAAFALMGPGEKTTNASALIRGFRHPPPSLSWPFTLGPHLLRTLVTTHDEVQSVEFFYRTDGATTVTGTAGTVTPAVPGSLSSAPNIYVPRHIAFYRVPS